MNKQLKGQIDINTALKQNEILQLKNRIELKQVMFFKDFMSKNNLTDREKDIINEYANDLSLEILKVFEKTIDNLLKKL